MWIFTIVISISMDEKTEQEWKMTLSPDQYRILRQCGTEPPFSGKYVYHKEDGVYICAGCGNELFTSDTKYESGSGWPSFWDQLSEESVEKRVDNSHGMRRIEVVCKKCGGHLGHVFDDGPNPTGLRYCINSLALDFKTQSDSEKE
ncbi:MAG: peptide-methionine (R)-S-oxide reductase MsrB [Candidatus Hodarchaeota archaeon]